MKKAITLMAALAAVLSLLSSGAKAAEFTSGDITVVNPWARASAGKARNGGAYMELVNRGNDVDRLIGASTPAAKKAELHTHLMEGDIMVMRQIKAIEINPGVASVLKPGGLHIMLMGLKAPLKMGETFPITLTFEKSGKIEIKVIVMAVGAMGSMNHDKMGAMDHGNMKH